VFCSILPEKRGSDVPTEVRSLTWTTSLAALALEAAALMTNLVGRHPMRHESEPFIEVSTRLASAVARQLRDAHPGAILIGKAARYQVVGDSRWPTLDLTNHPDQQGNMTGRLNGSLKDMIGGYHPHRTFVGDVLWLLKDALPEDSTTETR
jgi:hypothetical protein